LLLGDDCDIRQNHRFLGIAHTWVQLPAFFAGVQRYKHFLNKQKNLQGVPSKTPPGTLSPKKLLPPGQTAGAPLTFTF